MDNKSEQAIRGLEYAKNILNSITVSGIDNFQKISAVYNNIDVFLSLINSKELLITDGEQKDIIGKNNMK